MRLGDAVGAPSPCSRRGRRGHEHAPEELHHGEHRHIRVGQERSSAADHRHAQRGQERRPPVSRPRVPLLLEEAKRPPTLFEFTYGGNGGRACRRVTSSEADVESAPSPPHAPWSLRVVQNAFPAVALPGGSGPGSITKQQTSGRANVEMDAVGFHEVVIESQSTMTALLFSPRKR